MKTATEWKSAFLPEHTAAESWLEVVRRQVGSLNFGAVQIVVHGARVVQIERTEKVRLENRVAVANVGE